MTGTPGLIAFAAIWSAVAYRTWSLLRHPRGKVAWLWWRALLALAIAVSLFVPPIYRAVYALTGIPNVAELVGHWCILIMGWQGSAVLLFLVYSNEPANARRQLRLRGFLVLATIVVATIFFALIPADTNTTTFTDDYAKAPYIDAYWITYLIAVNVVQVDMAVLFLRYAAKTTREALRIGLRVVAAGNIVGCLYWVHWMAFLIYEHTTGHPPAWLKVWGTISAVGAVLLIVVGSTLPAWGRRVGLRGPIAVWRDHRAWRRMQPLWLALTREIDNIALPERGPADLSYRLYRRKVEMLDGILALQPYRDATVEQLARQEYLSRGLAGDHLDAAVEARALSHALEARRTGAAPDTAAATICNAGRREDVAWLARVSQQFARLWDGESGNSSSRISSR